MLSPSVNDPELLLRSYLVRLCSFCLYVKYVHDIFHMQSFQVPAEGVPDIFALCIQFWKDLVLNLYHKQVMEAVHEISHKEIVFGEKPEVTWTIIYHYNSRLILNNLYQNNMVIDDFILEFENDILDDIFTEITVNYLLTIRTIH